MTGVTNITAVKNAVRFLVLAGILAFAPAVSAEEAELHPVLKQFEAAGGKVDFLGNAYGTDGWIVTNPKGSVQYAYTTPEGGLIVGMMFSPQGEMETHHQLEEYKKRIEGGQEAAPGADKSASRSEKLYAEAEKSAWVTLGDSEAPYLYMFANVTCDHCLNFWKDLESAVTGGKLQVRLIPFGEKPANRDGGAALLSAADPEAAWRAHVAGDATALGADNIRPEMRQKVDANTALVKTWKLMGPPFTLYRRPGDGTLTAVVGRPENPLLLLAEFLQ